LRKVLLLSLVGLMILTGCLGSSNAKPIPVPEDILKYETTGVTEDGRVFKRTFTLIEGRVNVDNFCSGCVAEYYIAFWYVPDERDSYIGDILKGNRTTDTATLRKPLYKNDELGVTYLDNIFAIECTNGNGIALPEIKPKAVSYNPSTRELLIDGFPPNSQTWFSVTYFHSLPGHFQVSYENPGDNLKDGYIYDSRAEDWVTIPVVQRIQTVAPFTIRHVPVTVEIPENVSLDSGYKFEFWIKVGETAGNSTSIQRVRAYNQRWLINCR